MVGSGGSGHAFLGLTKDGETQYIGLYPVNESLNLLTGQTVDAVLHNNEGSAYTLSKGFMITQGQFNSLLAYIDSFDGHETPYSLSANNCADYVYDALNYIGIDLPYNDTLVPAQHSPQQLGHDLREEGLIYLNINQGITPTNTTRPCPN